MYEEVTFSLPGVQLRGRIYFPDGDGPHPVAIFHSGTGSVAEANYWLADQFTGLGLAVVFYDYRGYGLSGGEARQEADPIIFARDLRDVITLLSDHDDIDEQRISIAGLSLAGAIDLIVAGLDRRVASVVSAVAPISGQAARALFPTEVLPSVESAIEAARREQLLGGQSPLMQTTGERVPGGPEVMFNDPLGVEFIKQFDEFPSFRNEITLTSLGRFFEMELMPLAARITAPLLIILATDDTMSRSEDSREFFEQVRSPKLLEERPGGHYDVLIGDGYRDVIARSAAFIAEHTVVPASH
jgi:pimeloyl-ACP methyl ester carboxylesterase